MIEKIVNSPIWTIQYKRDEYIGSIHVRTTKPKNQLNHEIKKYSKYIEVTLEESDIIAIKEYLARERSTNIDAINITSYGFKDYYLKDKDKSKYYSYDGNSSWFLLANDIKEAIPQKFVCVDFPNIIDISKNKQERLEDERKAEEKLIENVMLDGINEILSKHGMELNYKGIVFKDRKSILKFVENAFTATIGKELEEQGLEYKMNKRRQTLKYNEPFILKKDIRIRKK